MRAHAREKCILAAVLIAAACGSGEKEGLCPRPKDESPVIVFNVFVPGAEELAPFPTDLKTVPDELSPTGIGLDYERTGFAAALNTLDGFGLQATLLVPVTMPVDEDSLPAAPEETVSGHPPLFLLNIAGLDPEDPGPPDARMIPVEVTSVRDQTALLLHGSTRHAIGIRPLHPFDPGGKYALVATSCLSSGGLPLAPHRRFRDVLKGRGSETRNPAAEDDVREVARYLGRFGWEENDFALITTFTTMSLTEDLVEGRETVNEGEPPEATVTDVYDAVDGDGNLNPELLERMPEVAEELSELPLDLYRFDAMGTIVFGTFPAASFLDPDGLLARDPDDGTPSPVGTEALEFILVLPAVDPGAGIEPPFRTLVFQHALGVCKETVLAFGDSLARSGIAVIGIDAAAHGSRSAAGPGTCTIEPMEFFNADNFAVTGDLFRQTSLDLMSLTRMVAEGGGLDILPRPGGDGSSDLDTETLAFAGQSMGSSIGILFLAFEPRMEAAVLNVAGGILSTMLVHSTSGEPGEPYPFDAYDLRDLSITSALQTVADKADPVNFARLLIREPLPGFERGLSILYQQAVEDASIPVESYGMLAQMMGIPLVEPVELDYPPLERVSTPVAGNISGGATAGLFQYGPPAPHEMLLVCDESSVDVMYANQTQAVIFLKTFFDEGTPVIVNPWNTDEVETYE